MGSTPNAKAEEPRPSPARPNDFQALSHAQNDSVSDPSSSYIREFMERVGTEEKDTRNEPLRIADQLFHLKEDIADLQCNEETMQKQIDTHGDQIKTLV